MSRVKNPVYAADFETLVNKEKTGVWLWALVNFTTDIFEYGNTIDEFIDRIKKTSSTVYFHNLKFDAQFILYYLLTHGFEHTSERFPAKGKFATLISDMGMFYTITVRFENNQVVKFIDSYKLIPLAIEQIPKAFGLKYEKLSMNYEAVTDINHKATKEEIKYIEHDVRILKEGVQAFHSMGMKKLTTASNALNNYKNVVGKDRFNELFPPLTEYEDRDCRMAYKGGWSYLNPKFADKKVKKGRVYDVNSMYPWAMKYCMLPYGRPKYYDGEYKEDKEYPLYIQCFRASFELKDNHFPSIQLKGNMRFGDTEYIIKSDTMEVMSLTSVDFELMKENYNITEIEYICGYKFKGMTGLFSEYVDYWYNMKNKAKAEGNKALYTLSKLMLNSLYGKFGTNPKKRSKYPVYDAEHDIVKYDLMAPEVGNGGYVPMAAFITSYARDKIIRAANNAYDCFLYGDTDSIHIIGDKEPNIEIDEFRLGAFKHENTFDNALFHRAKCYIEDIGGNLDKKCAGLPKAARDKLNFETMVTGSEFDGKLVPVNVPGGVVLIDRKFTIK